MNVFDLFSKISLDTSAYESALKGAKGDASTAGDAIGGIFQKAAGMAVDALKTAGTYAAGFVADSVKTGQDFDVAMSQVAATMGRSVDEIGELRDYAREMGATTKYSATESAEALNYMALAGYDAETSMAMLPNVMNLASAGCFELQRASDMVTDTQTAFGISIERTTQMVDEMAKAASTGNTNVEQLGDAFLTVGGLAQELNGGFVTLEDGTQAEVDGIQELEIALTAMANAGIKGSEAGTHMRNMLLKLTSPTAEGAEAFQKLGVRAFDANGKMKSLNTIFGDLNTSLSRLTQEEKLQRISELFNTRDTASAEALLNAIGEDWDHIGEAILDSAGAAEQMAETQLDNLAGDITTLKSAFEETKITISDMLSPALRDFVQTGTRELRNMTEAFQANGFRGLFTIIRLDLEQAQRHIESFIDDIDFAGMARKAGEKAPQVITSMLEAWTNPEWKKNIIATGFDIVDNLIAGLFSEESIDRIFDTENGAPKIIDNIVESIKDFLLGPEQDGEAGLFGAAKEIVIKLGDYFADEKNRDNMKQAADKIIRSLGSGIISILQNGAAPLMVEVARAWAECFIGEINYSETATEIITRLGQAFVHNMVTGGIIGQWIEEAAASYGEEVEQNLPREQRVSDTYYTAQGMLQSSSVPQFVQDQIRRGMGHAAGFYANRPAYLTDSLVGEAGDEVLLPLDSNTAWMDKLADKLGERMGGGSVVIQFGDINVTGTENIGPEIVEQIDTALRNYQIMQQRGVTGWAR